MDNWALHGYRRPSQKLCKTHSTKSRTQLVQHGCLQKHLVLDEITIIELHSPSTLGHMLTCSHLTSAESKAAYDPRSRRPTRNSATPRLVSALPAAATPLQKDGLPSTLCDHGVSRLKPLPRKCLPVFPSSVFQSARARGSRRARCGGRASMNT